MRNLTSAGISLRLSLSAIVIALLGACGGGGESASAGQNAPTGTSAAADISHLAGTEDAAADDRATTDGANPNASIDAIKPRRYAVEFLEPATPHMSSAAAAINKNGQVAGTSTSIREQTLEQTATVWNGTVPTVLSPPLADACVVASDINDAGQVTGMSGACTQSTRAIRWDGTTPIDLGLPGEFASSARGINAAGEVVGESGLGATLWTGIVRTKLTSLGGASRVNAVNNVGQAVGDSKPFLDPSGIRQGLPRATLWNGTAPTDLGIPFVDTSSGIALSAAMDINNSGQVVGFSTIDLVSKAVLWEGQTPTDLSQPGINPDSAALGINDQGTVVGYSGEASAPRATRWNGTVATDLNTLIPTSVVNAGWVLTTARGINGQGQIAGNALNSSTQALRGYRLTPLTESKQCGGTGWQRFGFANQGQCLKFLLRP